MDDREPTDPMNLTDAELVAEAHRWFAGKCAPLLTSQWNHLLTLAERGLAVEGATEVWYLENGNVLTPITRGMRPTGDHPLLRRVLILPAKETP